MRLMEILLAILLDEKSHEHRFYSTYSTELQSPDQLLHLHTETPFSKNDDFLYAHSQS